MINFLTDDSGEDPTKVRVTLTKDSLGSVNVKFDNHTVISITKEGDMYCNYVPKTVRHLFSTNDHRLFDNKDHIWRDL